MQMDTETMARGIAAFSRSYISEHLTLKKGKRDIFLQSPSNAFELITGFTFYQGRLDKVSKIFEEKAKAVVLPINTAEGIFMSPADAVTDKIQLKTKYQSIYIKLKENGVNKENDRLMVLSLINFIQSIDHHNMVKYIIDCIKAKEVENVHRQLDRIWSIGAKIASLVLRDIVCIYDLEKYLVKSDYVFLQPVDTWVHQLSNKIGLVEKSDLYKNEPTDIVQKCQSYNINPIEYNQGAWYIGTNSHNIVLKNIQQILGGSR